MRLHHVALSLLMAAALSRPAHSQVVNSEWNTGNGDWNVAGNWFPNAAPDNGGGFTYNVQIGNRPVAAGAQVDFVPVSGTSDTITSLTVSNNADLTTEGNRLNVLAATIIDGVGTTIRVDPHATPGTAALTSLDLNLNNGGGLTMSGGIAEVTRQLEINAGSVLGGHGTVNVGDADAIVDIAFENSALIQVQGNTAAPQTLTIRANDTDTIDLDGTTNAGVVDVDNALPNVNADTVTLIIDGPLTDAFGGAAGPAIQIGQRDTLTFNDDFTIAGPAAIAMNGGSQLATLNGPGNITSITGATFTITNAALIQNDMAFNGTANVITVNANSSLELGGAVVIPDASALVFSASSSQLIVSGDTSVIELGGDFNWDGPGTAVTTVEGAGTLTINVNHVDSGNDTYGGTLNLNDNADVSVNTAANLWTMAGAINKNNAGASTVAGDSVDVTGAIAVNAGSLTMPVTTLNPAASVVAHGTLVLGGGSSFAGPSSVTGTGTLRMASTSTVTASTTIGVATFDWDGTSAGSLHTINAGVVFTINSTTFDADGDMDDSISLGGNGGQLNVNGVANWTMAAALTTNPAAVGTATIGGTSRMTLAGAGASWTVTGNTTANAPVTFGSSATTIAAMRTLRLAGGDNDTNTNVMAGGTIGGAGTLAANDARELRGFGNIGATIDFDNTARLRADNGTLTIGGAILDVGVIGTADADGVLNVTNAWNNNVAAGVALLGGTVQGGQITNDTAQGIQGFGTVTSRVINNTQLLSFNGGTLIFDTAGNDNDWDGAFNDGLLRASPGTTLDLRDAGPAFQFGGTAQVDSAARIFVNNPDDLNAGFAFDFVAGSALNLNSGTYEATSSTDLEGTTTVAIGADSRIKVRNNTFLTFRNGSTTTLNGNLRLQNNNINIDVGATFGGAGALIVEEASHLVVDNGATVNVLLVNEGTFRPGGISSVGVVTSKDFTQTISGELVVDLSGSLPNQYDRLQTTGIAQLGGRLFVELLGGFNPGLGTTFDIVSTAFGVSGKFNQIDYDDLPAGKTFHVDYLPNAVRLTVVTTPFHSADFDEDGDVDGEDLRIWREAFDLNQLGDSDGDNDSDGVDFLAWQRQFGVAPAVPVAAAVPEPSAAVLLVLAAGSIVQLGRNSWRRSSARRLR